MNNELRSRIFRLASAPDDKGVYCEWDADTMMEWVKDYFPRATALEVDECLRSLLNDGELEGTTECFWFDPELSQSMQSVAAMQKRVEKAERELAERPVVEKEVVKEKFLGIQLLKGRKVIKKVEKKLHKDVPRVLKLAQAGKNIMLFGPTGCGKTVIGQHTAECLNRDFGMISFTAGASESALLGMMGIVNGRTKYIDSQFVKIFENGGVFLFDELDAADSNMLLTVNSALANGVLSLPKRENKPVAKRHPDFVCIATANTAGNSADRMYSGRSKLDAATLDRFQIGKIMVDYDKELEKGLIGDDEEHVKVLEWCWSVREAIRDLRLERAMSTRFILDARDMMDAGWLLDDIQSAYYCGWRDDELKKVQTLSREILAR